MPTFEEMKVIIKSKGPLPYPYPLTRWEKYLANGEVDVDSKDSE